jgi:hypothetical protein
MLAVMARKLSLEGLRVREMPAGKGSSHWTQKLSRYQAMATKDELRRLRTRYSEL